MQAEGIDPTWLTLGHHEIFARFTFNREWDVSELSFAKFSTQVTRQNPDIIALPVVFGVWVYMGYAIVNWRASRPGIAPAVGGPAARGHFGFVQQTNAASQMLQHFGAPGLKF